MKTVFKVGMKVYDQFNSPDMEGVVVEVIDDECDDYPIVVSFLNEYDIYYYTPEGRFKKSDIPTLSTKPYKIEFQGFEQKAPAPTFEEIVRDKNYIYLPENLVAPNKELADATKALLKLLFLRDYYNEGWQPDWCNQHQEKFCIINFLGEIDLINYSKKSKFEENKFYHVLTFETEEIRDKFLEDQKELLEIAKPLL
nr:MAG TPA: hypothetical protein [Caudoviricetes sp.]